MKALRKQLEMLRKIKRERHHPLLHKIHKKHRISRKTLFYVKEYGSHSNVAKTIIKESVKILLLSAIISSFGGFVFEHIKMIFISIVPLIILLPTLNDMIGDYGTIISSRFSTMLHEDKVKGKWQKNPELRKLFIQILIVSSITAVLSSSIALVISSFSDYSVNPSIALKILVMVMLDVLLLMLILFLTSVLLGLHFYNKKEDPNNFLIPITTSIADFGNMILLSVLIILLF